MHNDTWFKGGKDYIYAIKDFIDKASEYKQGPPASQVRDNSNSRAQNVNNFANNNAGGSAAAGMNANQGGGV